MGEDKPHVHSYTVVSRVMGPGDTVLVTYRCACGDTYTETEYT